MTDRQPRIGIRILLALTASVFLSLHEARAQNDIDGLEKAGRFKEAQTLLRQMIDSVKAATDSERRAWAFEIERLDRIRMDYSLTEDQLFAQLQRSIAGVTREEMKRWMD